MGVISLTFRPHYPGWVPETVDDVGRAKLNLLVLESNLCNLVAVLTEWSQNCLFFFNRLLQVLSGFRIKDHSLRKTAVYACTPLTVTKPRKRGCALEMRSGKTRATSLQAKELETLFGLLSLFLSHPSSSFFCLFLCLWLVGWVIREVGQIMT
jgi:hypothetical protein